ncbi:MAG: cytidylate kinase-like family protein [Clostridia bacterium]|nr:cytidylate kinase-like family protein [Clostridia bacterium]
MSNRVITISREFGSGGRTIGKRVAEKLGIPCYDAELIQKITEESGFKADYIKEEGEDAASGWMSPFLTNRAFGPTNQDKMWTIQHKIITDLAEKGSCVIVGRCSIGDR